jgi:hypothetical protein
MKTILLILISVFVLNAQVYYSESYDTPGAGNQYGFAGKYTGDGGSQWLLQHLPNGGNAGSGDGAAKITWYQGQEQFNSGWYGGSSGGSWPAFSQGDRIFFRIRLYYPTGEYAWNGTGSQENKMMLFGELCDGDQRLIFFSHQSHTTEPCCNAGVLPSNQGVFNANVNVGYDCAGPVIMTTGIWYDVQVEWQSSTTCSNTNGYIKMWINNNDYNNPTASITGINMVVTGCCAGSDVTWNSGFSLGNYWTDANNNQNCSTVFDDLEMAGSFDNTWYTSGGTPSDTIPLAPTSFTASSPDEDSLRLVIDGRDQNATNEYGKYLEGGWPADTSMGTWLYNVAIADSISDSTFYTPALDSGDIAYVRVWADSGGILSTSPAQDTALVPVSAAQDCTGLPFYDDFESNGFGLWDSNQGTTIETDTVYEGSYAARMPLTDGTTSDNYLDQYFGDHIWYGGDKITEVWGVDYCRIDTFPGWDHAQADRKIFMFNITDGVSSQRRYQVIVGVLGGNWPATGQYYVVHSYIDTWTFNSLNQNIGTPATPTYSGWDKIKLYAKLNTAGVADGIVRMWINGVLKLEYTNVNIRQGTSYGINKFILSSYESDYGNGDGVQFHDNFGVYLNDPDEPPSPGDSPLRDKVINVYDVE